MIRDGVPESVFRQSQENFGREGTSSEDISKSRLTWIMLGCMVLAGAIVVRAAYIQLPSNPRLEHMARKQFQANALVRPRRGPILDRGGEPLAINLETNSLAANPTKIHNKRQIAYLLSRSTHLPYRKLLEKLREKKEFVWIKRHLSHLEMKKLKKWKLMDGDDDFIGGLWLVKESDRIYPHGRLASHILGDVNVDSEGLEGVELWMNDRLRGKVVSVSAIKDALGRPTFIDAIAAKNVQDGESVSLTIDGSLQFEVEEHLANAVKKTGGRGGTVIVMNALNGEILALANEPSFSPNDKNASIEKRRNRAFTDGYEPGSTLKALLVAGALSHGWKLSDQVWGEKGSFQVQNHRISEAEAHEKFEWVSLKKMIQVSSNVAAAKVALKLGPDQYLKTLKAFGLGERSGTGFPGEIKGQIPPRSQWQPLTLANIGFGQGVLVTPIQMVRAYAAIANGGWLVTPQIVKNSDKVPPPPIRILSSRVSREVIGALMAVTEEGGTGIKAALPGYKVAGKTGTAQMVDPSTGKYSREKYVASFIGFPVGAPGANSKAPTVVVFASVVEPHGVYYASEVAAPLFREVLGSVANHIGIPAFSVSPRLGFESHSPPFRKDSIRTSQASLISPEEIRLMPVMSPNGKDGKRSWIMPSLKGLMPREVIQVLKGHHFQLEMVGAGVVSTQLPDAGMPVSEGNTVRLVLSDP